EIPSSKRPRCCPPCGPEHRQGFRTQRPRTEKKGRPVGQIQLKCSSYNFIIYPSPLHLSIIKSNFFTIIISASVRERSVPPAPENRAPPSKRRPVPADAATNRHGPAAAASGERSEGRSDTATAGAARRPTSDTPASPSGSCPSHDAAIRASQ